MSPKYWLRWRLRRAGVRFRKKLGSRVLRAFDKAVTSDVWNRATLILLAIEIERLTGRPFGVFLAALKPALEAYIEEVEAAWEVAEPAMKTGALKPKAVNKLMKLPNRRILFGSRLIGLGRPKGR
jgi:hypothetical protein